MGTSTLRAQRAPYFIFDLAQVASKIFNALSPTGAFPLGYIILSRRLTLRINFGATVLRDGHPNKAIPICSRCDDVIFKAFPPSSRAKEKDPYFKAVKYILLSDAGRRAHEICGGFYCRFSPLGKKTADVVYPATWYYSTKTKAVEQRVRGGANKLNRESITLIKCNCVDSSSPSRFCLRHGEYRQDFNEYSVHYYENRAGLWPRLSTISHGPTWISCWIYYPAS